MTHTIPVSKEEYMNLWWDRTNFKIVLKSDKFQINDIVVFECKSKLKIVKKILWIYQYDELKDGFEIIVFR